MWIFITNVYVFVCEKIHVDVAIVIWMCRYKKNQKKSERWFCHHQKTSTIHV